MNEKRQDAEMRDTKSIPCTVLYSVKESTIRMIWRESYKDAYPTLEDFIIDYGFKIINPE